MAIKLSNSAGYSVNWRKYHFQVSVELSLALLEKEFSQFLVPHPRVQTSGRPVNEPFLGIIAKWQGKPVGLILTEKRGTNEGLIVCWNVIKSHRGFGLGNKLIKQMEKFSQENNVTHLTLSFRQDTLFHQQIIKTLHHLNWQKPSEELMLYKFSPKVFMQMPWCKKLRLPTEFEIFSWDSLTVQDKQYIVNRQKQSNGYHTGLSPLFDRSGFEPVNSIGLRLRGKVIGWLVTHRARTDVIEYSSLFVSPELQVLGRGINLIVEAVNRQHAFRIPHGIFQVQTSNALMCSFVERRMSETIVSQTSRWFSTKQLGVLGAVT